MTSKLYLEFLQSLQLISELRLQWQGAQGIRNVLLIKPNFASICGFLVTLLKQYCRNVTEVSNTKRSHCHCLYYSCIPGGGGQFHPT